MVKERRGVFVLFGAGAVALLTGCDLDSSPQQSVDLEERKRTIKAIARQYVSSKYALEQVSLNEKTPQTTNAAQGVVEFARSGQTVPLSLTVSNVYDGKDIRDTEIGIAGVLNSPDTQGRTYKVTEADERIFVEQLEPLLREIINFPPGTILSLGKRRYDWGEVDAVMGQAYLGGGKNLKLLLDAKGQGFIRVVTTP